MLLLLGCSDSLLSAKDDPLTVTLVEPAPDQDYTEAEPITLRAVAGGGRGTPPDFGWYWSAAGIGALGGDTVTDDEGATLVVEEGLPAGDYTLTVLVTDQDGEGAEDSVDIHVLPLEPPEVAFLSPAGDLGDCDPVAVMVQVEDEGDLTGVALTWSGLPATAEPPAAPDEDGLASFALDPLTEGAWTFGVTATDLDGGVGTASVSLAVSPCVPDLCNGLDDDGDGVIDEDAPTSTWYADADGDGHGDPAVSMEACEQPDSYVDSADDCDDEDPEVFPGATERCNDEDDDCDGEIDEGVSSTLFFGSPTTGEVYQIATDGSGLGRVVAGMGSVSALELVDDELWINAWDVPEIKRITTDGTGLSPTYDGNGSGGQGVAVDNAAGLLFWGEYYGELSVGVPDGSSPGATLVSRTDIQALIGSFDGYGVGLEVDPAEEMIYFFTRSNAGFSGRHLLRAGYDGTGVEDLRNIESMCMDLDLDAGKVYFADTIDGVNQMWRMDLDGSAAEALFGLADGGTCSGVSVDPAGRIYYLQDQTGAVWSQNTDGTDPVELTSGHPSLQGLELSLCE